MRSVDQGGDAASVSDPAPRHVVMVDVARRAGVSHQTVSRVINDPDSVKAETRARVLAAIRELDYRPNRAARALATGRTGIVGVVAYDTRLYGPASTLHAIQLAAQAASHAVNIVSLDSLERAPVLDAVDRLRGQGVDGIIIIAPEVAVAQALMEIPSDLPVVAVEGLLDAPISVVAVDQVLGATKATRHLLDLGHVAVWHITGPGDWYEARAREQGWRSTLEAAGIQPPEPLPGDWSARSGYEQGGSLLESGATAVFVANDQMALGVMRAVHEAGMGVPGDISIVGFDDIPEASYYAPPLTTVRQEFLEVGTRSMSLLLRYLRGEINQPIKQVVEPDLVVRASTAPPRR